MANFSVNEFLDKYLSEITSRLVADSGIDSDRFHLGKLFFQSLKEDPDFVMQIDAATGESETNGSVLKRSIRCATSFRNMGLKTGDVIILMSPNHLDQAIPLHAALYLGVAVAPIDRTLGVYELQDTFEVDKPKIVFCQSEKVQDVKKAVDFLGLDTKVVSFDKSPHTLSFHEMLVKYGEDMEIQDFKVADFDPDETNAFLVSTSGSTGLPKSAAITHKNCIISAPHAFHYSTTFPGPTRLALLLAPMQWLSTLIHYMIAPYLKYPRVQTSLPLTPEHFNDIVTKYQPSFTVVSPPVMITLLRGAEKENCDLSCLEIIFLGGSAVPQSLLDDVKRYSPKTKVYNVYGMSELCCLAFYNDGTRLGSSGKRVSHHQYKLVNTETKEEILEPYQSGELWLKGPGVFKGYYNNPEVTAEVFAEDQWFMSGDIFYRDEDWNYYFVERIKLLLKYKNHQISPVELESVIRQHPGVLDVAVTGIPDPECGDLPVACVVLRPDANTTAQEIQDLVKEKLTDSKQLRGGVIFLKELPLTTSTKVHRRKLKELVIARTGEQLKI